MKSHRTPVLAALLLAASTITAFCQPSPLRGSSSFGVNIGLWNQVKASQQIAYGIKQLAKTSGFIGGITYSYWMREYLAITADASLLSSEASSTIWPAGFPTSISSFGQRANSVFSVLLGMKYYVPQPDPEDRVRPFVTLGVGSYVGVEAENSLLSQSAHSESVIGARVGAGVDAFVASWFKIGANIGYNFMDNFTTSVGTRNNFNGYEMSFGFGFVL